MSADTDDATTLKVQLGELLDRDTTQSLRETSVGGSTAADAIRRNPKSSLLAFAGVAALVGSSIWLLASLARGSRRD